MLPKHNSLCDGFTLIELLAVMAIIAILVALAMPSWCTKSNDALIHQAKLVLQRLAIRQHRFLRGHGRFAQKDEQPSLDALGGSVAQRYELQVESGSSHYLLRLIDADNELPDLMLNHLGQWGASEVAPP